MSTSYAMNDSLPKDQGGAKFAGLIDTSTSQLDFSLIAGIGTKIWQSKNYSAMFAANGIAGCKVENPAAGNLIMAHFASNASVVAPQGAIPLRGDDRGAIYTTALSSTTCAFIATSRDTITTTSGLLYQLMVSGCGVLAGACVTVLNGATSLGTVVFSGTNENLRPLQFVNGTCFASLITEKRNTVGAVYITPEYRLYGQG